MKDVDYLKGSGLQYLGTCKFRTLAGVPPDQFEKATNLSTRAYRLAIKEGRLDIVTEYGLGVPGNIAYTYAAIGGDLDMFRYVHRQVGQGQVPLGIMEIVVRNGNMSLLREIERMQDVDHDALVYPAVISNSISVVNYLLKDVTLSTEMLSQMMTRTAKNNNPDIIEFALDRLKDKHAIRFALDEAAKWDSVAAFKALAKHVPYLSSALYNHAYRSPHVTQLLIKHGVPLTIKNAIYAIAKQDEAAVDYFVDLVGMPDNPYKHALDHANEVTFRHLHEAWGIPITDELVLEASHHSARIIQYINSVRPIKDPIVLANLVSAEATSEDNSLYTMTRVLFDQGLPHNTQFMIELARYNMIDLFEHAHIKGGHVSPAVVDVAYENESYDILDYLYEYTDLDVYDKEDEV